MESLRDLLKFISTYMLGFIASLIKFIASNIMRIVLIIITFVIIKYIDNHFDVIKNVRESLIDSIKAIKSLLKGRENFI